MARALVLAGALLGLAAWIAPAAAEEVKAPVSAAMLLNLMSQPVASRGSALDDRLRDPGPPTRPANAPAVTFTVRNPCPPGAVHYEPPPLPGRRYRY